MNRIATRKANILIKISLSPFNSLFKCTVHTLFSANKNKPNRTKWGINLKITHGHLRFLWKRSGSIVDCFTRYQKVVGLSPIGGTVFFS